MAMVRRFLLVSVHVAGCNEKIDEEFGDVLLDEGVFVRVEGLHQALDEIVELIELNVRVHEA
jgi:hypothetical protein